MTQQTPHLAHHFHSRRQQLESSKLGMWLFLATEILLFGGLFCAYAVYRANHPEVFSYAHQFLDKSLGGLNTVVLICSSLTMAWAVRAAQLGQQRLLRILLAMTLVLAFVFLGVKYVEYQHKWKHGLLWGKRYHPEMHAGAVEGGALAEHGAAPAAGEPGDSAGLAAPGQTAPGGPAIRSAAPGEDATLIPPPGETPHGLADEAPPAHDTEAPRNVQVFFSIYFAMTGLHAIHVLAGIACISWLLLRARRGEFGPDYYTPVDLVGLYWHVVDMIWIYLFPLLYLIH